MGTFIATYRGSGLVNAEALVTKIYDISKWDKAYQHLKSGEGIKALLKPLDLDENEESGLVKSMLTFMLGPLRQITDFYIRTFTRK